MGTENGRTTTGAAGSTAGAAGATIGDGGTTGGSTGAAVLTLAPGAEGWAATAERVRAARRDATVRAVLVDAAGGLRAADADDLEAATRTLRALGGLAVPAVAALDGAVDASGLALALTCSHVIAGPRLTVALDAASPADPAAGARALLALGVPWLLVDRLGAARAHALLLGPRPVSADRLSAAGLVEPAGDADALVAARAVAQRLADDPAAPALLRSLRAAQRSTAAQSADFDRALIALLEEGDDDVR